ncbi:adenosine deaminase [Hathewaya histolytica]|uniref:adenosine deaminase n=1 Tax=Hathewaya histolytica TaxID=1498 RepID=UPI003B67E33D
MLIKLPKIELHCHLDGSLRPETIIDIAKKEDINLFSFDIEKVRESVIAPLDCESLDEYLERFAIPNKVMQSKESLRRITFELFEDAAKENVKYMEVRFAPLLHTLRGLTVHEVIESVIQGLKEAEKEYDIKGNIILGCMRIANEDKAFEVVEDGKRFLSKGVVGIDLCASEVKGFAHEFKNAIGLAREYGYRVTIHAGETGIGENVLDAIEVLGAERIGHGVYIKNCKEAYKLVKDRNILLEMCPTSNIQTKAVESYEEHPFYDFYKAGIKVSVNTDNRTVSNTDMTNECEVLFEKFGITKEDYKKIYLDSVDSAFTDEDTKNWLKQFIK